MILDPLKVPLGHINRGLTKWLRDVDYVLDAATRAYVADLITRTDTAILTLIAKDPQPIDAFARVFALVYALGDGRATETVTNQTTIRNALSAKRTTDESLLTAIVVALTTHISTVAAMDPVALMREHIAENPSVYTKSAVSVYLAATSTLGVFEAVMIARCITDPISRAGYSARVDAAKDAAVGTVADTVVSTDTLALLFRPKPVTAYTHEADIVATVGAPGPTFDHLAAAIIVYRTAGSQYIFDTTPLLSATFDPDAGLNNSFLRAHRTIIADTNTRVDANTGPHIRVVGDRDAPRWLVFDTINGVTFAQCAVGGRHVDIPRNDVEWLLTGSAPDRARAYNARMAAQVLTRCNNPSAQSIMDKYAASPDNRVVAIPPAAVRALDAAARDAAASTTTRGQFVTALQDIRVELIMYPHMVAALGEPLALVAVNSISRACRTFARTWVSTVATRSPTDAELRSAADSSRVRGDAVGAIVAACVDAAGRDETFKIPGLTLADFATS